jgi:hypothetical protein
MATFFFRRGGPSLRQVLRGKFPYLLIVEKAAILIVAYLTIVGITHFRVEAVAAAAATGALALSFVRHVNDSRAPALGARAPGATREPPGQPLRHEHHEHGEGRDVTVAVVVVVPRGQEG